MSNNVKKCKQLLENLNNCKQLMEQNCSTMTKIEWEHACSNLSTLKVNTQINNLYKLKCNVFLFNIGTNRHCYKNFKFRQQFFIGTKI